MDFSYHVKIFVLYITLLKWKLGLRVRISVHTWFTMLWRHNVWIKYISQLLDFFFPPDMDFKHMEYMLPTQTFIAGNTMNNKNTAPEMSRNMLWFTHLWCRCDLSSTATWRYCVCHVKRLAGLISKGRVICLETCSRAQLPGALLNLLSQVASMPLLPAPTYITKGEKKN